MNETAGTNLFAAFSRAPETTGGSLIREMRWLLAWEQAYLSQTPAASKVPQEVVQRLEPTPKAGPGTTGQGGGPAGQVEARLNGIASQVRDGAPMPLTTKEELPSTAWKRLSTQARTGEGAGSAARQDTTLARHSEKPAANPARPAGRFAQVASQAISQRSVHVLGQDGNLALIIRDQQLSSSMALELATRLRSLVNGFSGRFTRVVLNGELVWSGTPVAAYTEDPAPGEQDRRVNLTY